MELQENVTRSSSRSYEQSKMYRFMKRLTDIIISFILLFLLSPLFLFICYWIMKKEGKPIFYRELNVGKENQTFIMWKFRTMTNPSRVIRALPPHPIPDSWQSGVPKEFTFLRDSYRTITPTGKWLRKYRLHKLPQLWNVLKGNMSLIGPKPEIPEIVDYYNAYQLQRLKVKPGMTGFAQINDQSMMNYRQQIEHDLYYIENLSYKMDTKIFLLTIKKILVNK